MRSAVPGAVSRHAWVLGVLLLGCASLGGTEEELVIPEDADPPRMADGLADEAPAAAPPPAKSPVPSGPACTWERLEPQRLAALVPPPENAECRPAPGRKRMAELRRLMRKQWMWRWPDYAKLSVEPGCDRLGSTLSTVVFESSSGHGGSLYMLRLDRRADGDWDATWIDYNHYDGGSRTRTPGDPWREDATGAMTLWRGVLPGARVDRMLQRTREALHVEAHELEAPPPPDGTIDMGSYGFSSRDFHVDIRLVDASGHGIARYFGGYESGDEGQAGRLALELAGAEVWEVLGDEVLMATLHEVTPDDPAIRALLGGQFWHARERGGEETYGLWYLRERLFGLAAPLGSDEHVPALLEAVRPRADEESWYDRTRVLAINAIAEITGFDVRYDAQGKPRSVPEVAAEVLRACDGG